MSFVRPTKTKRTGPAFSHKTKGRKKPRKPQWDSTVSDLSVHKASPEEIQRRKAVHKSSNLDVVREELQNKSIAAARKQNSGIGSKQRQSALIKEVLYDHNQLLDVLSRSDRTMAVVKDLFGDAPPRYKGIPNVTHVPDQANQSSLNRSEGLIYQEPEISTQMDMLSESHMDRSALNEMEEDQSEEEEETADLQYHPQIDLNRFRHFLEKEKANSQDLSNIQGSRVMAVPLSVKQGQASSLSMQGNGEGPSPPSCPVITENPVTPRNVSNVSGVINGTEKTKRTKSKVSKTKPAMNVSGLSNINDLKQVLASLENELADYEQKTGRQPAAERLYNDTFSGYTVAIVDSVTRVVRYLKQTEIQLAAEMTVREHLSQDVQHLNQLVDAVTSDIISTQEENVKLREEFVKYKQHTEEQFNYLKNMYSEMNKRPVSTSIATTVYSAARRPASRQDSPSVDELATQMTEALSTVPRQNNSLRVEPAVLVPDIQRLSPATGTNQPPIWSTGSSNVHGIPGTNQLPTWTSDSSTAHVVVPKPAPLVTHSQTHRQTQSQTHSQMYSQTHGQMHSQTHGQMQNQTQGQQPQMQQHMSIAQSDMNSYRPSFPTHDQMKGQHPQQQMAQADVHSYSPSSLTQPNISLPEYASLPASASQPVPLNAQQWRPLKEVTNMQPQQPSWENNKDRLFKSQIMQITQQVAELNEKHSRAQEKLHQLQNRLSPGNNMQENRPQLNRAAIQGQQAGQQGVVIDADIHEKSEEKENLSWQVKELKRQNMEAQQKMAALWQQQAKSAVSPPISPIPLENTVNSTQGSVYMSNQRPQPQTTRPGNKGITVALPRIEDLEISATSTPSPKSIDNRRRSGTHGQVPIVSVYSNQGNQLH